MAGNDIEIKAGGTASLHFSAEGQTGVYSTLMPALGFAWRGHTFITIPWPFSWPMKKPTPGPKFTKD